MPPRRRAIASTPICTSNNVSTPESSLMQSSDAAYLANLQALRRCWQWAAFSQFFYTFAQLLQMPDVSLSDVEDDLARGTSIYLPRIMTRLLVAMSLDRKLTIDNWQTGFRKQCLKRGGLYNPLGPEPIHLSQNPTPEPENLSGDGPETTTEVVGTLAASLDATDVKGRARSAETLFSNVTGLGKDKDEARSVMAVEYTKQVDGEHSTSSPLPESKDWVDLTMQEKLEALHTVTEWQFDNPHRLRQQMKDDGDSGHWRIEPIGYDAKTNAYWLIGPDRLWVQRALPKMPRPMKRKRAPPMKKPVKVEIQESESEPEQTTPPKRTRTASARSSRTKGKAEESTPSGRGARAAKLKANKKLDVQAKELAEFQKQAGLLASPSRSVRATRSTRASARGDSQSSLTKRPIIGIRASARLRGAAQDSDDEWQQVPDEWLEEEEKSALSAERPTRGQRKKPTHADEEEGEESVDGIARAGLGSDAVSDLTELSDDEQDIGAEPDGPDCQQTTKPVEHKTPANSLTNGKAKNVKIESLPEKTNGSSEHIEYAPAVEIPKDFVEWEAICITLPEWEAICEHFAHATHYLEKALHKMLSQSIVPAIVAELREAERKRKVEEAVVHRKRSSRIALKETEKEEARAAAMRQAEEDEKLARFKRMEARAKKEDVERQRREQAREQRRLEREARELKISNRNQPKETSSTKSSAASTPVPGVHPGGPLLNGVVISTPLHLQMPRTPTPNVVRSPDWFLDCEICGKKGMNLDDSLPTVSCGTCGRWQHITCHDAVDHNAGYPKRNWTTARFTCRRCRTAQMHGVGRQQHSDHSYPAADGWSQLQPQKATAHPSHAYSQDTSDSRYSQQPAHGHRLPYGAQQHPVQSSSPAMYTRNQQRQQGGIAFSHVQPDQRGYGSNSPVAWSNGYPSMLDGQQFVDPGVYSDARATSSFVSQAAVSQSYGNAPDAQSSYHRAHDAQGYNRASEPQSYSRSHDSLPSHCALQPHFPSSNWSQTPESYTFTSGQRSASHISAAESLAFMQESAPTSQGPSYVQHPHMNGLHHSTASPVPMHYSHTSMSNGHRSSYQFPASS